MTLAQVEAFLTLAEELHFGRTAERMYLSQSRVSRLIASLETEVGGTLFDRTSRRVRITPLGAQLRDRLSAAVELLDAGFEEAHAAARGTSGLLRIGITSTTGGQPLDRLVRAFEERHPDCEVTEREVQLTDPFTPLREDEIDVLVNWLALDEPDLTAGPVIDRQPRVLAVAADHPLAERPSVSIEDLADQPVNRWTGLPPALWDAIVPPSTPSGKPIPRTAEATTLNEGLALVARGKIVHPTVRSMIDLYPRRGVVFIPIHDMPPLPLGLIWVTAHENARMRALAQVAEANTAGRDASADLAPTERAATRTSNSALR
jgi:DNA-binding transcriptional LysR family regulator